jgi:sulfite reductase alpha subunit-like flavoprotein
MNLDEFTKQRLQAIIKSANNCQDNHDYRDKIVEVSSSTAAGSSDTICYKNDNKYLEKLLTISHENIKSIEPINKLRYYKIKMGDAILNNVEEYKTFKELIDDANAIFNNRETAYINERNLKTDKAIKELKSHMYLVKQQVFYDILKTLELMLVDVCKLVQSGIPFENIYNMI